MLKLLRTVPRWRGQDRFGPVEDLLGLLWGSGGLEVFLCGHGGLRSWKSPDAIHDVAQLRGAIEEGLRHLGGRPGRAVMVLLHPELVQLQLEVPAAASASVVRALVQRALEQQKPVKGLTRWCDAPLIRSGDQARRLVYAMPEGLYQSIREVLRDLKIEMCSLVPFSGLVFLEVDADEARDAGILQAWHLPCGLAVGLRRGPDLWMVRSLVLDPGDARRVSRELRQTLGFAREHWGLTSPWIQLRGPVAWTGAVTDALRSEGVGNERIDGSEDEDWRPLVLRRAMGSDVDLVPVSPEAIQRGRRGPSMGSRPAIAVALPGLFLAVGLLVEGYRVRGRIVAMEHERKVVERALEEEETWAVQQEQARMLIHPWQRMPGGTPAENLTAWITGVVPEGLVLTELDLWQKESGWHLTLSGRSADPNGAVVIDALDRALASAMGADPQSVVSRPPSTAVENVSWAELLARESHAPAAEGPIGFRKEWILP